MRTRTFKQNSGWFQRKLPGTYIGADLSKLPDPHFVSGVIKIQMNQLVQLTEDEKVACARLVNQNHNEEQDTEEGMPSFATRMKERLKKRKAGELESTNALPYINADFICGSAAEVERLWSIAKHILTNSRARMTPHLFEALFFLKINHDYWDCRSVQEAYCQARKDLQSPRVQLMMEEDENYGTGELNIDALMIVND